MLFAHGSDLCYEAELRHAMANCFEALFGAIFLDGGVNESDRVLAKALYGQSKVEPLTFFPYVSYYNIFIKNRRSMRCGLNSNLTHCSNSVRREIENGSKFIQF